MSGRGAIRDPEDQGVPDSRRFASRAVAGEVLFGLTSHSQTKRDRLRITPPPHT